MKTIATLLAAAALLALTGCQTYEVNVALRADGGGSRAIVLELDGSLGAESTPTLKEYRGYFNLDAAWEYSGVPDTKRVEADGLFRSDRVRTRFTKDIEVKRAEDWSALSGDVSVRGSLDKGPFGAVRFSNHLNVRRGGREGARTLEYRETFRWTKLREVLVKHQVDVFLAIVGAAYPALSETQLAELRGVAAAGFLMGLEMNLRDVEEEVAGAVLAALEGYARENLGLEPEPEGADVLRSAFRHALLDPDNQLEAFLAEKLPGVDQAALTDLELRVTMPGPIIETNADSVEGQTAVWRIELLAALNAPVQARALAALPR
jgi:hypothetical protein